MASACFAEAALRVLPDALALAPGMAALLAAPPVPLGAVPGAPWASASEQHKARGTAQAGLNDFGLIAVSSVRWLSAHGNGTLSSQDAHPHCRPSRSVKLSAMLDFVPCGHARMRNSSTSRGRKS